MNSTIIVISTVLITLLWWGFWREHIGYIVPNILITKYQKIPLRIIWLWMMRYLIVASLVALIVWVGIHKNWEYSIQQKQNILIVLDISRSMLAEDISPSRIEAAKQTINTFLTERRDDLFWLIVFAGKSFVSIPFSGDTRGIGSTLSHIDTYYIRQELPGLSGTAIGDALLLANSILSWSTDKSSIILITDWRANVGIDPVIAAQESRSQGIPIYTIAIGGTSGEPLTYTDTYTNKRLTILDEDGSPLISDIDEVLLQNISQTTWGTYFRATGARDLYGYWDSISKWIWESQKTITETRYISYRIEVFMLLIALLLIERYSTARIFYKKAA